LKAVSFLFYLFIEVFVTISIATQIGALYTFLIIVFTAMFGIFLIFSIPFKFLEVMQNVFGKALSFATFGISTILRFFAGILLILPGFFGDMLGLVLLIGSFLFLPKKSAQDDRFDSKKNNKEEFIDVEIIDDNNTK
jgi:UPF0716 family protein affecting phage T7 exclusion